MVAVHRAEGAAEPRQPATRQIQRLPIAIDTDQAAARTDGFEQQLGVAARTQCRVDDDVARLGRERLQGLAGEHRTMRDRFGHERFLVESQ